MSALSTLRATYTRTACQKRALEKYVKDFHSWDDEKDEPEDKNDHTINANQYAWIPYKNLIGFEEDEK